MKIFMLIKWLHNSGAPRMFSWLAEGLAANGHEVVAYTYMNVERGSIQLSPSITHVHENLENVGLIGKIKHIRKAVMAVQPQVSISFLLDANVYNMFACKGLSVKSVVCERNDPFKPRYYKLKFWKPWFRLADGAVFQLPKVADYYSNIKGITAVIPNPVKRPDVFVDLPFTKREDKIVTVGRIDIEQKRQDVLIKAFALFREKHPSYKLVIYGGGKNADKEKIERIIADLNIGGAVCLEGSVDNPIGYLLNAKFFVMTSDFEGIPNALIEAMSAGLPCISTDCRPGGASLLIENGINGILVETGDVGGLAHQMDYLASHPDIADSMGELAKNISVKFSEGDILSKWNHYLQEVVM